jgi:hypothetical protein
LPIFIPLGIFKVEAQSSLDSGPLEWTSRSNASSLLDSGKLRLRGAPKALRLLDLEVCIDRE